MLNTAHLSWNANTEPNLQGYIVYASLVGGIFFNIIIASTILLTNSYTFTLLNSNYPDGEWFFSVVSISNANIVSNQSAQVSKRMIRSTGSMILKR